MPLLARVAAELETVERYVVVGDGDVSVLEDAARDSTEFVRYDDVLAGRRSRGVRLPRGRRVGRRRDVLHERHHRQPEGRRLLAPFHVHAHHRDPDRIAVSRTRGTTASSRSCRCSTPTRGVRRTRHGWPAPICSCPAATCRPSRWRKFIASERPTTTCAVPTIWADLLRYSEDHDVDFSSLQRIMCGGAAVPRALMEAFQERFGIRMLQAWGMTETSPVAAVSLPPRGVRLGTTEEMDWRALTGRPLAGVELRIVDDDGTVLPWDGEAVGEIQCRGSWITGSYYGDPAPEKFDDGWLRTGDIASVTPNGYVKISDRSKDVIKSGGEWISSVELEGHLMAHPDIVEAAVIAVPDPGGTSARSRASSVARASTATPSDLRDFLASHVAKWQLPNAGRSSPRCRRRASASSTRRCCARSTPTASSWWWSSDLPLDPRPSMTTILAASVFERLGDDFRVRVRVECTMVIPIPKLGKPEDVLWFVMRGARITG